MMVMANDAEDSVDFESMGARSRIADAMVQKAAQLVVLMAVLERIQAWRDEQKRGPGGRPETFPMKALLVAMVLCVATSQPLLVTSMTDVLFFQISPAMRGLLGVPDPPGPLDLRGRAACYRNVRTRLHTLLDLVDPSVLPKNRRLEPAAFEAAVALRRAMRSEGECEIRRQRLTWFINQILEASYRMLPREYRRQWRGSVAVDATVVRTFARPERRTQRRKGGPKGMVLKYSADPDAAWYHREPDARDEDASPSTHSVWGYEMTIVVAGTDDPDGEPAIPSIVVGMAPLHRPGHEPGQNAVIALGSVNARGHHAGYLAADRAYSGAKSENFQLPARSLGYRLVLDYKDNQLGVHASFGGFLQIEGNWYCPSIPEVLINATIDYRNAVIDEDLYRARLDERWLYRARQKQSPDGEGHMRMQCPAAGHPMARCELKAASVTLGTRGKLRIPVRAEVRANPPQCCSQSSVIIPPEAGAKLHQDLLFGSPKQEAIYASLRNSVEGFNGYVKDGAHEALDDHERRRLRGVAAQSVLSAFLVFSANLRKVASFLAEQAAVAAGTVRRLPRRRSTQSLETWRPDSSNLPAAVGIDPSPD